MSRKQPGKGMSKGMSPELIVKMRDGQEIQARKPIEEPSIRTVPASAPRRGRGRTSNKANGEALS